MLETIRSTDKKGVSTAENGELIYAANFTRSSDNEGNKSEFCVQRTNVSGCNPVGTYTSHDSNPSNLGLQVTSPRIHYHGEHGSPAIKDLCRRTVMRGSREPESAPQHPTTRTPHKISRLEYNHAVSAGPSHMQPCGTLDTAHSPIHDTAHGTRSIVIRYRAVYRIVNRRGSVPQSHNWRVGGRDR